LIYSNYSGQAAPIKKEPVNFIATDQSDRLLIQYSILVSQYSISKEEYDFWNNLKQVNESGGDIFAKQPLRFSAIFIMSVTRLKGFWVISRFSGMKQKRKT